MGNKYANPREDEGNACVSIWPRFNWVRWLVNAVKHLRTGSVIEVSSF
jgi:hypothetical protein